MPTRRPLALSLLLLAPAPVVAAITWFFILFFVSMSQGWRDPQPGWLEPVSVLILVLGALHVIACIVTGVLLLNGKDRCRWLAVLVAVVGLVPALVHLVWWLATAVDADVPTRIGIAVMDLAALALWVGIAWLARRASRAASTA